MTIRAELLRVEADDPEYRRMAAAEAAFWGRDHAFCFEMLERQRRFDSPIDRHTNLRFTGDLDRPWEASICRYGTFRRGLVLGTSLMSVPATILATNPGLHLTVIDLSRGALQRVDDELGRRFAGRVDTVLGDLNFPALEHDRYDCIVSSSTLHHIINLEALAEQINHALVADGYFFLQDYVGEPRNRFSPAKKRIFERLYAREAAQHPGRRPELSWRDAGDLSPFCGVRADEILGILGTCLSEVSVRTTGTLTFLLLRSLPGDGPWPGPRRWQRGWETLGGWLSALRGAPASNRIPLSRRFIDELLVVEDVVTDAGLLAPAAAFAVYRKRSCPGLP